MCHSDNGRKNNHCQVVCRHCKGKLNAFFTTYYYNIILLLQRIILSAVKACLIIVGTRPSASQLVACIVMSTVAERDYYTSLEQATAKSRTAAVLSSLHRANAIRNCSTHGFAALMIENQSLQLMLTIYRTNCRWLLSVRSYVRNIVPWIPPKSGFFFLRLKSYITEGFFNNPWA